MNRLAIYTENRDYFVALVKDLSNHEEERYEILVLHVVRNDPDHGVQYSAGDRFTAMVSKVVPGASAFKSWDLEFIDRPGQVEPRQYLNN